MNYFATSYVPASTKLGKSLSSTRLSGLNLVLVLLQLFGFWSSWLWTWNQLQWGSEGFAPLLSLCIAIVFVTSQRIEKPAGSMLWLSFAIIGTSVYALLYRALPNTLLAILAVTSLGASLRSIYGAKSFSAATFTLLVLSVPLIDELQFYCGYLLRLLSAEIALPILWLAGFPVRLMGAAFEYHGKIVAVDAPCSGIFMLWSVWFAISVISLINQHSARRHILVLLLSTFLIVVTNAVRISSLTVIDLLGLSLSDTVHSAIGLFCFIAALLPIVGWRKLWC